ncbi:unnamed protein product [Blepharisma stoltei]|uniref:Uncharacterized protein n=1 Tax=Blepharisma stoltei TaxID=1481888 RepID=A0AAU9JGB8_9CILI|nr:unnamed protein product [Blepharisma stoltei]
MYLTEIEQILVTVLGKEEVPLKTYTNKKKLLDQWLVDAAATRKFCYTKIEQMIAAESCDEEFARLYLEWTSQLNENPRCGIPAPEKPKRPYSDNPRATYILHKFIKIFDSREHEFKKTAIIKFLFHEHNEKSKSTMAFLKAKIQYLHFQKLVECYNKRLWMEKFFKAQQFHKFRRQTLLASFNQDKGKMIEKRKKNFLSNILTAYYKRAMLVYFNAFVAKCIKRKSKAILCKSMLLRRQLREKFNGFQCYKLKTIDWKSYEKLKKNEERVAQIEKNSKFKRKLELLSMLKMGIYKRINEALFIWENYVGAVKLDQAKAEKTFFELQNVVKKYAIKKSRILLKSILRFKANLNNKNKALYRAVSILSQFNRLILSRAVSRWSTNLIDKENQEIKHQKNNLESNNENLKKLVKNMNDEMIYSKLSLSQKIDELMSQNIEKEQIQVELQKEVQLLLVENQLKDEEQKQLISKKAVQTFKLILMRRQILFTSCFSKWKFESMKTRMHLENQKKLKLDKTNFKLIQMWYNMSTQRWTKIMSRAFSQFQINSSLVAHKRYIWRKWILKYFDFEQSRKIKFIKKWNEKVKDIHMKIKFSFLSKALERRFINMSAGFKKFKTILDAGYTLKQINTKKKLEFLLHSYSKGVNMNTYKYFEKFKQQIQKIRKGENLLNRSFICIEKETKVIISKFFEKIRRYSLEKKNSDIFNSLVEKQLKSAEEEKLNSKWMLEKRKKDFLKYFSMKTNFRMKKAFDILAQEIRKQIDKEQMWRRLEVQGFQIKCMQKWINRIGNRQNYMKYAFLQYKLNVLKSKNEAKKDEKLIRNACGKLYRLVEAKRQKENAKKVIIRGQTQIGGLIKESLKKWAFISKNSPEETESIVCDELNGQINPKKTKISHMSAKQLHKLGRPNDKIEKQKDLILRRLTSIRSKLINKSKLVQKIDTSFESPLNNLYHQIFLKTTALYLLPNTLNHKKVENLELEKNYYTNVLDQLHIKLNELHRSVNFKKKELLELQKKKKELPEKLKTIKREKEQTDEKIEKLIAAVKYLREPKIGRKIASKEANKRVPINLKLENDKYLSEKKPEKIRSRFDKPLPQPILEVKSSKVNLIEFAIISFIIGFSLNWLLRYHIN